MHELGLAVFTLLLQTATGFSVMLYLYRQPVLINIQHKNLIWIIFGIATTSGCALLIAMTHMGYPLNALYALTNYNSSWLSREVILAQIFIGLIGVLFLLCLFKKKFYPSLLLIAATVGASDVFSLANIYKSSSVITWSTNHSLAIHIGGMLLLGSLGMICILSHKKQKYPKEIKQLLLIILAVVFVRVFTQIDLINNLDVRAAAQGVLFPWDSMTAFHKSLLLLQVAWGFGILGVLLTIIQLFKPETLNKSGLSPLLLCTLLSFALYEILCRVQFYLFHM